MLHRHSPRLLPSLLAAVLTLTLLALAAPAHAIGVIAPCGVCKESIGFETDSTFE